MHMDDKIDAHTILFTVLFLWKVRTVEWTLAFVLAHIRVQILNLVSTVTKRRGIFDRLQCWGII